MVKVGKWEISEEELATELAQARESAKKANETEPRALSVRYDQGSHRLILELNNGCTFAFPPDLDEELSKLSPEELMDATLTPSREGLRWQKADIYLSVPGLLAGIFGSSQWMSALAARAGRTKTEKKASSSRENGKRGGRPKKHSAGA